MPLRCVYQGTQLLTMLSDDVVDGISVNMLCGIGSGEHIENPHVRFIKAEPKTRSGHLFSVLFEVDYCIGDRAYSGYRNCTFGLTDIIEANAYFAGCHHTK